jgi:hypothetical protein
LNRDHGSDPLKSVIAEYAELRREKVKVEARLTQRTQRYAREDQATQARCIGLKIARDLEWGTTFESPFLLTLVFLCVERVSSGRYK